MVSNMDDNTTATAGLILVDKPVGLTSHDVVRHIREVVNKMSQQKIKVGHTGTLDPFATGLLVIVIGSATRLSQYTLTLPKEYQATLILGASSDTDDSTGKILTQVVSKPPSLKILQRTIRGFTGPLQQIPPAYAAVKIKGRKMYQYARAGESIHAPARAITIHNIILNDFQYPQVNLTISCSSGTYIRSLARDLGQVLGTGGYVSELRRLAIGKFSINNATKLSEVTAETLPSLIKPARLLVDHLPAAQLDESNVAKLQQGREVLWPNQLPAGQPVALFSQTNERLIGTGQYDFNTQRLRPIQILAPFVD